MKGRWNKTVKIRFKIAIDEKLIQTLHLIIRTWLYLFLRWLLQEVEKVYNHSNMLITSTYTHIQMLAHKLWKLHLLNVDGQAGLNGPVKNVLEPGSV
ncbi:unnamed protein product, partial [Brassica oleracea]